MLVRHAPDPALPLKRVEAVDHRFVGDNLASELDLSDEGRLAALFEVTLDKLEEQALFVGEGKLGQTGLRLLKKDNKKS